MGMARDMARGVVLACLALGAGVAVWSAVAAGQPEAGEAAGLAGGAAGVGQAAAGADRVQRADDPFTPSRHGFAFVNRFTGSSLPPELRDAQGGVMLWARNMAEAYADLPEEFGLCGGMSLSAADYYLAGEAIPGSNAAPEQGTELYEAIYGRQRDSLGLGSAYVLKFAHWMSLPDIAGAEDGDGMEGVEVRQSVSSLTRAELPGVCRALERGELVPLGLVLGRTGRARLWNNHQVLGYGLERVDDATLHVRIYDPNYPGDDACIIRVEGIGVGVLGLDAAEDAGRIAALRKGAPATSGEMVRAVRLASGGRARAVRGVFPMPYEPAGAAMDRSGVATSPSR